MTLPQITWPDLSFPPVNLWVVMSAEDFYKLKEMYGIPNPRLRDIYLHEGESILAVQQAMFDWDKD